MNYFIKFTNHTTGYKSRTLQRDEAQAIRSFQNIFAATVDDVDNGCLEECDLTIEVRNPAKATGTKGERVPVAKLAPIAKPTCRIQMEGVVGTHLFAALKDAHLFAVKNNVQVALYINGFETLIDPTTNLVDLLEEHKA